MIRLKPTPQEQAASRRLEYLFCVACGIVVGCILTAELFYHLGFHR